MAKPPGLRGDDKPIRLRARDGEDIAIVSALLQDAVVTVSEMSFEAGDRRFVLVAGRFRWEAAANGRAVEAGETPFERVHTGLRFEHVSGVRMRGIDRRDPGRILNLLSVSYGEGVVELLFAGDSAVRLDVSELSCHVEDLGDPWPTMFRPSHDEDDDDGSA